MARLLVLSSSNYYNNTSGGVLTGPPFSLYWRGRFTSKPVSTNQVFLGAFTVGGSTARHRIQLKNDVNDNLIELTRTVSGTSANTQVGAPNVGVYFTVVGSVVSSTEQYIYMNTDKAGGATSSVGLGAIDGIVMGARVTSSVYSQFLDGDTAECGCIPFAATDAEVAAFAAGYNGRVVWPRGGAGRAHWNFFGHVTNEPDLYGGVVLTPNGTPAKSDHPRVIMPRRRALVPSIALGSPPLSFPPFFRSEPSTHLRM